LRKCVGFAGRATPPLPSRAGEPTEKSLFLFQKISAGEISKIMQRVFLAGRSARLRALGGGAELAHFSSFPQNRF